MRLGSRVTSDDVGFKSFYSQKDEIEAVAMLDHNFIIYSRTSNGLSVDGIIKDRKWIKVAREIFIGWDIDPFFSSGERKLWNCGYQNHFHTKLPVAKRTTQAESQCITGSGEPLSAHLASHFSKLWLIYWLRHVVIYLHHYDEVVGSTENWEHYSVFQ